MISRNILIMLAVAAAATSSSASPVSVADHGLRLFIILHPFEYDLIFVKHFHLNQPLTRTCPVVVTNLSPLLR
jgi:hypothetical protein